MQGRRLTTPGFVGSQGSLWRRGEKGSFVLCFFVGPVLLRGRVFKRRRVERNGLFLYSLLAALGLRVQVAPQRNITRCSGLFVLPRRGSASHSQTGYSSLHLFLLCFDLGFKGRHRDEWLIPRLVVALLACVCV